MRIVDDFFGFLRDADFGGGAGRGSGGGGKLGKFVGAFLRAFKTEAGMAISVDRFSEARVSRFIMFRWINQGATNDGSSHAADLSHIGQISSVKVTSVVWWWVELLSRLAAARSQKMQPYYFS